MPCSAAMRRIHLSLLMLMSAVRGACGAAGSRRIAGAQVGRRTRPCGPHAGRRHAASSARLRVGQHAARRRRLRWPHPCSPRHRPDGAVRARTTATGATSPRHFVGVPMIVFGVGVLLARATFPACGVWPDAGLDRLGAWPPPWYLTRGNLVLGLAVSVANRRADRAGAPGLGRQRRASGWPGAWASSSSAG